MPPAATRLRRDFGAILALIRAHAVLHSPTRERDEQDRIIASIETMRSSASSWPT
jgi:hypothetical protein